MGKRTLSPKPRISKIIFDIPTKIGSVFIDNLIVRTIEKSSEGWMEMYGLLTEYKEENGDVHVPVTFKYKDKNLGMWCNRQRTDYKKGRLSEERIKRLKEIGFKFKIR